MRCWGVVGVMVILHTEWHTHCRSRCDYIQRRRRIARTAREEIQAYCPMYTYGCRYAATTIKLHMLPAVCVRWCVCVWCVRREYSLLRLLSHYNIYHTHHLSVPKHYYHTIARQQHVRFSGDATYIHTHKVYIVHVLRRARPVIIVIVAIYFACCHCSFTHNAAAHASPPPFSFHCLRPVRPCPIGLITHTQNIHVNISPITNHQIRSSLTTQER